MASDNSWVNIEKQLIDRLKSSLPTGITLAMVKMPNAPFTTPSSDSGKWLRVTINGLQPQDLDAAGACELTPGICTIDVFVAKTSGSIAAMTAAQHIKNLYNGYRFDDLVVTSVAVLPRGEDGNWYRVQVDINFEFQSYDSTIV